MKQFVVRIHHDAAAEKPAIGGHAVATLEKAREWATERVQANGKAVIYEAIETVVPLPPPPKPPRSVQFAQVRGGVEFPAFEKPGAHPDGT